MLVTVTVLLCVGVAVPCVEAHGYMLTPAGRSSAWRVNNQVFKPNYDDNGLYCGGRSEQWDVYGGKCGICGDSFGAPWPKANERYGEYYTGNIMEQYRSGDVITVTVRITANHWGSFWFSLFRSDDMWEMEQEDLFIPLNVVLGGIEVSNYTLPDDVNRVYTIQLKLPTGDTCSNCVLRWKYMAGNSWGCDGSQCCTGCGPIQEHFISCADVMITTTGNEAVPPWVPYTAVTTPIPHLTAQPTAQPTTAAPTQQPTAAPTQQPTAAPTAQPTAAPTQQPTAAPTPQPTAAPTQQPTAAPTQQPTAAPTQQPTAAPTAQPTAAQIPQMTPSSVVVCSLFCDFACASPFMQSQCTQQTCGICPSYQRFVGK